MTKREHLLTILSEECSEAIIELALAQQRMSKALRFGDKEIQPGQQFTNAERIMQEFCDIVALLEMLESEGVISMNYDRRMVLAKKAKVEEFLKLSKRQGTLTE